MKWIKLPKYCELSGDTPDAVHAKRKRGIWADGIHCRVAGDGCLWVNTEAVDKWAETSKRVERPRVEAVTAA